MSEPQLLFAEYDGIAVLANQQEKLKRELDAYDVDAVLTASIDAICDYFVEKYRITVPVLEDDPGQIEASQEDAQFDARRDPNRIVFDASRPVYIPGTRFTFHVRYTGDRDAFFIRANTFTMNPPRAVVTDDELQFPYTTADPNEAPRLKAEFEREPPRHLIFQIEPGLAPKPLQIRQDQLQIGAM